MRGREYFYRVDREGALWHDDSKLEDQRFLDFFFRRLRRNDRSLHADWPWVSRCGNELNYARAETSPIVFKRLDADGLHYAGTLTQPFAPESLRVGPEGQLWHPSRHLGPCLLAPRITLGLGNSIEEGEAGFVLHWNGREHRIAVLAENEEQ